MDEKQKEDVVVFHNAPTFYVAYTENWLIQQKKKNAPAGELAIVEDLHKLVKIAVQHLNPIPAVPGKEKN